MRVYEEHPFDALIKSLSGGLSFREALILHTFTAPPGIAADRREVLTISRKNGKRGDAER